MVVAYDGSRYAGYQRQPDVVTVQGTLEAVLGRVLRHPVRSTAAGRTDRGVHALGQVVSFTTGSSIPVPRLALALRKSLPPSIVVTRLQETPLDFHPRRNAVMRTYRYLMAEGRPPSPFLSPYVTLLREPIDWELLESTSRVLLGTHSFLSFCTVPSEEEKPVRTLDRIKLGRQGPFTHIDFQGRSFLRGMIRNIMGWLLEVGAGRRSPGEVSALLDTPVKDRAVPPAPPNGLYLVHVEYPPSTGR